MATVFVSATLPGLDHALLDGRAQQAVDSVIRLYEVLSVDAQRAGTTADGAWAVYGDAAPAVCAFLAAGAVGAACGVVVGDGVPVPDGPPIGAASWLARALASQCRPRETLMPRATFSQLADCIPRGVGQYAAPSTLGSNGGDVVLLKDFRSG